MAESVEMEYVLTLSVEDCMSEVRKVERLLFRTMALMRRMGLPEDVQAAIDRLQRLVSTLRAIRLAMHLLQTATGPLGWAMAGIGILTAAAISMDTISSYEVTAH